MRSAWSGRVVAHDELLPTALELADKIAARPPLAVQKIKEGLRRALDPDWNELGMWVSTSLRELFQTEDHREGVKSFLEKRPAVYVGSMTMDTPFDLDPDRQAADHDAGGAQAPRSHPPGASGAGA